MRRLYKWKTFKENKWVTGFCANEHDRDTIFNGDYEYNIDLNTLCESTCMKDSEGKEIFEGDILLTNIQPNDVNVIVKWTEDKSEFELTYENGTTYGRLDKSKVGTWEIIGNIHD